MTRAPDERNLLRQTGHAVRTRLAADPRVQTICAGKAEIWGVPDFFAPDECAALIALIDEVVKPTDSYEASDGQGTRTSSTAALNPDHPLVAQIEARIDGLLGLHPRGAEFTQGQRYSRGQEFQRHRDWFQPNSAQWARENAFGGQRSITAMVYLNTVEAGGETDFPYLDIAIRPGAGTLIAWNNADAHGEPNPLTEHAGNPVAKGEKYIVTRWYRCRPWR